MKLIRIKDDTYYALELLRDIRNIPATLYVNIIIPRPTMRHGILNTLHNYVTGENGETRIESVYTYIFLMRPTGSREK